MDDNDLSMNEQQAGTMGSSGTGLNGGQKGRQGRVIPSQLAHQHQLTSGLQPRGYPKPLHPLASHIGGTGTGRQKIASVTGNK